MLNISIPKNMEWNLPEGRFPARLTDVQQRYREHPSGRIEQARLYFEVAVPGINKKTPMAAQSYDVDMRPGTELRRLLESWQGKQWIDDRAGSSIDLHELVDQPALIELHHVRRPKFTTPLVCISHVHPANN